MSVNFGYHAVVRLAFRNISFQDIMVTRRICLMISWSDRGAKNTGPGNYRPNTAWLEKQRDRTKSCPPHAAFSPAVPSFPAISSVPHFPWPQSDLETLLTVGLYYIIFIYYHWKRRLKRRKWHVATVHQMRQMNVRSVLYRSRQTVWRQHIIQATLVVFTKLIWYCSKTSSASRACAGQSRGKPALPSSILF